MTTRTLGILSALTLCLCGEASGQVVPPVVPDSSLATIQAPRPQETPFLATAMLASLGSAAGIYGGAIAAMAVDDYGDCTETCLGFVFSIPLVSAVGSWLGARASGAHPSAWGALGGSVVGIGAAYVASEAGFDGAGVLISYSVAQGLVTALSTLHD